ncbi:MAG TPA: hypothetical protein VEJ20_01820 [Candidatus Eremiobacteraceae bacterium]|nr:hypothetical protein [Candidatus Eremiobacteraceae bacterium]
MILRHSYIIHRAAKMAPPSRVELRLIDRYFQETGVVIPWTRRVYVDPRTKALVVQLVRSVLRAA